MPHHVIIARDPLIAQEAVDRCWPAGLVPDRHYVSGLDLGVIFTHLGTADLFASQRGIHYIDFLSLDLGKNQQQRLRGMLDTLPEEVTLVCSQVLAYERKTDEARVLKGQLYQCWTAGGHVVDLRTVGEGRNAVAWLKERAAQRYRLALSPAQAQRVLQASQDKPALADAELRKLWLLKADEVLQPISDTVLDTALSTNPAAYFYEMVDALLANSRDWPARLLQWYGLEPDVHKLVNELRRRWLGLLDLHRGLPVQPPFFAQQLARERPRWPLARLREAIEGLAALEFALKSGATVGETSDAGRFNALQVFLADLLAGSGASPRRPR